MCVLYTATVARSSVRESVNGVMINYAVLHFLEASNVLVIAVRQMVISQLPAVN